MIIGITTNINLLNVRIGRTRRDYLYLVVESLLYPLGIIILCLYSENINFQEFIVVYATCKFLPLIIFLIKYIRLCEIEINKITWRFKNIIS